MTYRSLSSTRGPFTVEPTKINTNRKCCLVLNHWLDNQGFPRVCILQKNTNFCYKSMAILLNITVPKPLQAILRLKDTTHKEEYTGISPNKFASTSTSRGQCKLPKGTGLKLRVTSCASTTLHAQTWPGWTRGFCPRKTRQSPRKTRQGHKGTRIWGVKNFSDLNTFRLVKCNVIGTAKPKEGTCWL